ncbi:alpha-2 adrenergic receptor [Trichonephila clavipes]|nr:alpha-2 adrenergic receptor [Trichonephila clavipes]
MKIGNNGNLVLGPFDESTPFLMIVLMNCQTKLRINHLAGVKLVAILESNANLNFYTWKKKHPLLTIAQTCSTDCRLLTELEVMAYGGRPRPVRVNDGFHMQPVDISSEIPSFLENTAENSI